MSNIILFKDNASTTLAAGIGTSDTSITVATGTGALFPAPASGQILFATLEDAGGNVEIVTVTTRTTDTFVVTRGTDGTTPQAFASGTRFEMRVTMGMLNAFLQKNGGDTLAGTTTVSGVLQLGSGGSLQGGEYAGGAVRSQAGDTSNQIKVPVGSPATAAGSIILTASNLLSNLPSGVGAVITGMILLWSGLSSNVPSGYVLCDGTNGTPDLRDQFVLGGGGSLPTTGGSSVTITDGGDLSGLSIGTTALTIDQIPSHTHAYWLSGVTFSSNGHPGVIGIDAGGSYTTNLPTYSGGPPNNTPFLQTTGGSGGPGTNTTANPHTHSIAGSTAHTHDYSLPPYRAVFYIMKT